MPQWGAFLFVIALVTVVMLGLARQSQGIIHDQAPTKTDSHEQSTTAKSLNEQETAETSPTVEPPKSTDSETELKQTEKYPRGHTLEQTEESPGDQIPEQTGGHPPSHAPEQTEEYPRSQVPEQTEIELTSAVLLLNVAVTQAIIAAIVIAAAWYFAIPADAFGVTSETLASGLPGVLLGVVLGIALWVANEFATTVADAVGASYDETVRAMLSPETSGGWVGLFVVVLPIIAFAEELLFRAALIGVPAAGFEISPWLLAVVSSLAFALGHGAQGRVGIIVTGVLGFALAGAYILTASLLVVFVAHYVINALEFFIHEFLGVESPFGGVAG